MVCDESHTASSRSRPRCLKTGQWSETGMECRFNRHKLKNLKELSTTTAASFVEMESPLNGSVWTTSAPDG